MAYPSTIDSFVTLLDNIDTAFAAHQNDRGTAITNVETALGANLKNVLYNKYISIDSAIIVGTDTDHDVDYPKIEARSDDDLEDMLVAAMTKRFDATWVAGTGNGGMQSGSSLAANTGYLVYAIDDSARANNGDMQAVPIGTAFAYPSGYDIKRLSSFFHTDASSNIVGFVQNRDVYSYDLWQILASGNVGTGSWTTIDITDWVPALLSTFPFGSIYGESNSMVTNDSSVSTSTTDEAPNRIGQAGGAVFIGGMWQFEITTANTLYWQANNANNTVYIAGFMMNKLR